MVESSTVHYYCRCDWCGLENEGTLAENGYSIISIIDPEYRKKRGTEENLISWSTHNGKHTDLCPACYHAVQTFLRQSEEERKLVNVRNNSGSSINRKRSKE